MFIVKRNPLLNSLTLFLSLKLMQLLAYIQFEHFRRYAYWHMFANFAEVLTGMVLKSRVLISKVALSVFVVLNYVKHAIILVIKY